MTPQTLTKTLLAALMLTSTSQATPALRAKIAAKEKDLATLQAEIAALKGQLKSGQASSYTVKPGDTISSIARRHRISPETLIKTNGITNPSVLKVGQVLKVKTTTGTVSAQTASKPNATYTVKKGDTFYSIARRHGMTVSKLQALNPNVNVGRIVRGQKLVVSGSKPKQKAKAKPARTAPAVAPAKKISTSTKLISAPKKVKKAQATAPKATKKTETKPTQSKAAPIPTPIIRKEKPMVIPQPEPMPLPPTIEEEPPSPSGVSAIILTEETTFDAFAAKHGTSTDKLNKLNGWNIPKSTTLARGSEIYIPK